MSSIIIVIILIIGIGIIIRVVGELVRLGLP